MKSQLTLLWQSIAADAAVQCRTSADLDSKRIEARFEHEGEQLFTLSLPAIGKEFERALDVGRLTPELLSLTGAKSRFPVFLGNFVSLVFSRDNGVLLYKPSPVAIQAVRQLTLGFGKMLTPCSKKRERAAFDRYVEIERELDESRYNLDVDSIGDLRRICNLLFGEVFSCMDQAVYYGDIVPRHGPGATADKLRGNEKYQQEEWTERLERVFPAMEHLLPNLRYHDSLDRIKFLDPGAERPVRVISVPKTARTPRIIAIEPTCMQYMQQGLLEAMRTYVWDSKPIRDMMGLDSQFPNQELAQEGSLSGTLATLDLSEASDRVPNWLVVALLDDWTHLSEAVQATRSLRADVPGHGVIPLIKFASMGSALTFPVEEILFLTVIFYSIEQELGRRLSYEDLWAFKGRVRVYGDDIIVPVEYVQRVLQNLWAVGSVVNESKSFWTGRFRESCGKEYYAGEDVSIFRVRRPLPSSRADELEIVSAVSLRNQAYEHGYWGTAKFLDGLLEGLIPFPNVEETSQVLGRHSVLGYSEDGWNAKTQNPLVKGVIVRSQTPPSKVEDEWALLKCFLKRGAEPYADERHLERQGRPSHVGIKTGWAAPF
jgi:hypothetical protein